VNSIKKNSIKNDAGIWRRHDMHLLKLSYSLVNLRTGNFGVFNIKMPELIVRLGILKKNRVYLIIFRINQPSCSVCPLNYMGLSTGTQFFYNINGKCMAWTKQCGLNIFTLHAPAENVSFDHVSCRQQALGCAVNYELVMLNSFIIIGTFARAKTHGCLM
jgi:hypothetical protein